MYDVKSVAKYVISYCREQEYVMSNLKLQKVLYFVQAAFLSTRHYPCFEEDFEAWDFGPVVPEIYHEYKIFGSSNIIADNDISRSMFSAEDREIIDDMVDICSGYSASELVSITHSQSPWKDAYRRYSNNIISKDAIEEFFSDK